MRDDLFELVSDSGLKKFFLAGHSMGGKTAISFALKWPEMLNGLLVADISPFTTENTQNSIHSQHSTILNAVLSIDLQKVNTREDVESQLSTNIPSEKERGLILKNLERTTENTFAWKFNPQSLSKNLKKIMVGVERPSDFNSQITGFPIIFLKGGDSEYIPTNDYKDILKVFPAAEIIEIPGAGHWIQVDKPDEVVKYMRKLLQ
jgi:pimeloyl-ACP methyl ester carboxylesterase